MTSRSILTWSVVHTFMVGETIFVRIFRRPKNDATPCGPGPDDECVAVFATSRERLQRLDPDIHGLGSFSLADLDNAVKVVRVITDVHEGRQTLMSVVDGLRDFLIDERQRLNG